jgi:predicted alpha/beta superfamily hydrolase
MADPAILHGTETHLVHSDIMDFDFEISVQGPPIEWPEPLPVIYSTDANFLFGFSANAMLMLLIGGEIPPVLNIGIGYPVGADLAFVQTRRMYDLLPPTDKPFGNPNASSQVPPGPEGGGAPLFMRFMVEELWPWVTANYKVSDDRTYVGDSQGGMFGCYALLKHHGFFNRYVIGSPWLCWDPELVPNYEEQYAGKNVDLDAVVFLAAGGAEDVLSPGLDPNIAQIFEIANTAEHTQRLGALLATRKYPSLRLKTLIFPDETHFTVPFALIPHGLRYVFGTP